MISTIEAIKTTHIEMLVVQRVKTKMITPRINSHQLLHIVSYTSKIRLEQGVNKYAREGQKSLKKQKKSIISPNNPEDS
ncbi:MAG: hypothetical protein AABW73_03495 [Nanoarchaeota archaeon]